MAEDHGRSAGQPDEPVGGTAPRPVGETAPPPADGTRVLPPVAAEPERWSGSASVRPPRPDPAPVAYGYEEEPLPIGPGERNWMLPVIVGAVALLLLGALLTGLWLIFTADDDQGPAPDASSAVATTGAAPTTAPTTRAPTSAAPTTEAAQTVPVPRLLGLSEDEARQRLSDVGLRVEVERRPEPNADPGTVVEVQPGEGTEVAANSVVRIVVANDPSRGGTRSASPTPLNG
ncbi:hypothetical protein Val02_40910 [Virgisporangium aliadipatigenens]|uniref:PASTA domain-containing protein n=1 Tax=Virgisporangium aliadipatigenens TaxID=741659 RepID=A0A8J3YNN9_9ACTN|nr:PASTA domain-containing protein [Virgisporangium aliadipatigenens]GIJ47205.1 hypothetical protein Val02_40910 [Virgisporangium aliadipatigenens]